MAKKMIGLSLSLCVRDILCGVYTVDDVVKIICGTLIKDELDFDFVTKSSEGYNRHYWQRDPDKARDIFMQLLLAGKIDQPRLRGEDTPNLQNGHWIDTQDVKAWGKATVDWLEKRKK